MIEQELRDKEQEESEKTFFTRDDQRLEVSRPSQNSSEISQHDNTQERGGEDLDKHRKKNKKEMQKCGERCGEDTVEHMQRDGAVSYTHLTLPTIYSV